MTPEADDPEPYIEWLCQEYSQGVPYRGWLFLPPFRCMNCGNSVSHEQFCFSLSCAFCATVPKAYYANCIYAGPRVEWKEEGQRSILNLPETRFGTDVDGKCKPGHVWPSYRCLLPVVNAWMPAP